MNNAGGSKDCEPATLTVLVTCYNEARFITDTLETVTGALADAKCSYEVIVIDDASTDDSAALIGRYIEAHPDQRIRLRVNAHNLGLGNNYVEGAFMGTGDYYRLCCGDNPESREVLANIFRHVGRADTIIPYQRQREVEGKTPLRKGLSRTFTTLVNVISGYDIRYYNGLAVHRRADVMRWHPSSYGFGFQADILTKLLDEGVSYLQIPSSSVDRKGTASSALQARNILSVGHTLLEISIRRVRRILYGKNMKVPVEVRADQRETE